METFRKQIRRVRTQQLGPTDTIMTTLRARVMCHRSQSEWIHPKLPTCRLRSYEIRHPTVTGSMNDEDPNMTVTRRDLVIAAGAAAVVAGRRPQLRRSILAGIDSMIPPRIILT